MAQILPRWNPLTSWMRQIENYREPRGAGLLHGNQPLGHICISSQIIPYLSLL